MRLSMLPLFVLLAATPLAAQDNITPNGSRITNPGVTRASATVDSVFVEKRSTQGRVDVGDFTAYLLARLGVPPSCREETSRTDR